MNFDWLQVCADSAATGCIQPVQLAYLVAIIVGAVLFAVIARRSRDLSTATLTLMVVAIAINVAVGSITFALRLPIYLDSIGTVLVGVLAGPWAGALTGLLSNLIWSILPIPGGAGPNTAFFAPVAAVIGLMAGFWGAQGVFRLRPDDARVGGFLAIATGIAAAMIGLIVVQATIGIPSLAFDDPNALDNQMRFVLISLALVAFGVVVGWASRRTIYRLEDRPESARQYLTVAAAVSAGALLFALFRLLFGSTGYFSTMDGLNDDGSPDGFPNLTSLALTDPLGFIIGILIGVGHRHADLSLGFVGRQRPPVPGLGRRPDDRDRGSGHLRPDRGRRVRWRDRWRHGRARRALPDARSQRVPVRVRAGPHERPARQDDQLHGRVHHPRGPPGHRPDDVQPRRGDGRRLIVVAG